MIDRLLGILQGINDKDIKLYLAEALQNSIKHINVDTHEIFFNDEQKSLPQSASRHESAYNTYSAKYVANAIQQCNSWDFHKTVANCGTDVLDAWLEQGDAIACGQDLINDFINERINFNVDLTLLQNMADELKKQEIKIGLAEFMRFRPWTGNVILTFLLQRNGDLYKKVLEEWQSTSVLTPYITDIQMYSWLQQIKAEVDCNSGFYQQVSARVKERINVSSTRIVTRSKGTYVPGTHDVVTSKRDVCITTYGADVVRWLEVVGSVYGVKSGTNPKNIHDPDKEAGCVKAGTLITMADGTNRPVEALRKGDRVLNAYGEVSICSAEMVVNPNVRTLYSVNDDAPFMSLEHPVLTQRGYCCLNPSLALSINDTYPIYELQPGDVILKYAGTQDGEPRLINVPVEKINVAANEDICYDLHFSDGWNSYIANGYCVLLAYPVFTANEVGRKLRMLEGPEQSEFHRDFLKAKPMLQRLIPAEQLRFFEQTLFQDKKVSARADFLLGERILHFDVYGTGAAHPGWKNLTLYKGSLLFDEQDAVVTEMQNDVLYWRRQTNGAEETGMLKFLFNHRMAVGVVETEAGLVPFTAVSEVSYRLTFEEQGRSLAQAYVFTMGFEHKEEVFIPCGRVTNENGLDLNAQCRFYVERDPEAGVDVLKAHLDVSDRYAQRGLSLFSTADLSLTPSYKSLHGTAENPGTKRTFAVTGTLCDASRPDAWARRVRRLHMTAKADAKAILQSEILSRDRRDTLLAAAGLCVEELYGLPQPESLSAVHERAFTVLKKMMLYVIDDKWRKDYFNVQKPSVGPCGDLSQAQAALAQTPAIKNFLCNEFALGFITNSLYKSENETIVAAFSREFPDKNAVQNKLDYFWKGSDSEKCFSKKQGYNAATTIIYTEVYADYVPRLKDYKNDTQKTAADWAKDLYVYCTNPVVLLELALSYCMQSNAGKIMHLSSLLNYLDPEKHDILIGKKVQKTTYANALYFQVVNYLTIYMRDKVGGERTAEEKKICEDFLNQFFITFFTSLLDDESIAGEHWDAGIRTEAVEEIKKLMEEHRVSSVKELVSSLTDILSEIINLYTSIRSASFLEEKIQIFASKHPTLSKILGTGSTIAFYGLALFEVYTEIKNFSQMSTEQKTAFIIDMGGIACIAFNDVAQMRQAAVLANAQTSITARLEAEEALASARQFSSDLSMLEGSADQIIADASANVAARTTEEASVEAACARWGKITKVSGAIAKAAGILVMAGATVVLGFQTARDFAEGQPVAIKVLDIIDVVSCGIGFLATAGTELAGLFVESVCAAIPIVGWIAAVVGIFVSIVMIFIHRNPIKTEPERFIEEHCIGFIKGLAEPPKNWLEKQDKLRQHLSSANAAVPYSAMKA